MAGKYSGTLLKSSDTVRTYKSEPGWQTHLSVHSLKPHDGAEDEKEQI